MRGDATWADAMDQLARGTEHVGHALHVQGAFGWMFRGRDGDARSALEKLPDGALEQVAVAAAALSTLADEVVAGREGDHDRP